MARFKPRALRTQASPKSGPARRPGATKRPTSRPVPPPPPEADDSAPDAPTADDTPTSPPRPAPAPVDDAAVDEQPTDDTPADALTSDNASVGPTLDDASDDEPEDDAPGHDGPAEGTPEDDVPRDDAAVGGADDADEAPARRPSPRPRRTKGSAAKKLAATKQASEPARKPSPRPRTGDPAPRPRVKAPARPTAANRRTDGRSSSRAKNERPVGRRAAARRAARRRVAALHVVVIVLAVLAVLSLPLAGLALYASHRADSTKEAESQATSVAQAAAPAILSYDYRTFDASVSRGKKYTGGAFAGQYAKSTGGLKASAKKVRAVVKARVAATSVVSASPNQVVLLMYVDQYRQNINIDGQKVDQNRVLFTMTRQDGSWKVTKVTAI
ncbi:MAG TPA: hypothetical protein VGN37_07115 [Actinocatenispora sp.]